MALTGFRQAVMVLRDAAELAEKHPALPFPDVKFGKRTVAGGQELAGEVMFHVWGKEDYGIYDRARREEAKRLEIEHTITTIMEVFDAEGLEWVANDPSDGDYNKDYFILTAKRGEVQIKILTYRSNVGEFVDTVESGPQVIDDGETVQLVRQSVTVWKPNLNLSRRAVKGYELEAKPLVLALTQSDPY